VRDLYPELTAGRLIEFQKTMILTGHVRGQRLSGAIAEARKVLALDMAHQLLNDSRLFDARCAISDCSTAVRMHLVAAAPWELASALSQAYARGYNAGAGLPPELLT
jgi:hypothetical protein